MHRGMSNVQGDCRAVIDIGTTSVRVLVAARRSDRRLELAGMGVARCDGLRKGAVTDVASLAASVREAAAHVAEESGLNLVKAYLGLAGAHIDSDDRWSHVPRDPGVRAVTNEDLARALEHVSRFKPAAGQRVLHVIPRSYTLDGVHGVRNPEGMHTGELHIQSQVISGPEDQIEALEAAVNSAGIIPAGVIVEPMATAEAVLEPQEKRGVTALVDIGGAKTDIAVFHDGTMLFTAVLPVGGYQFTNDLSIAFSLPYAESEQLKIEQGTVIPDMLGQPAGIMIQPAGMAGPLTVTHREVGQVLRDRAEELIEMVRMKLDVPVLAQTPVEHFVLTGGGAQLRSMAALAKHVLQKPVRLGVPKGIDGLPEADRDPSMAAAIGMAVWAMRNLPADSHVLRQREPSSGGVLGALRGWLPLQGPKNEPSGKMPAKV